MATTALLTGGSPFLKLKQGTQLGTSRPLPVKLSIFAPIICKNPTPPQCYSLLAQKRSTHHLTADSSDHLSLTQCLNVSQDNRPSVEDPNIISKIWEKSLRALRKPEYKRKHNPIIPDTTTIHHDVHTFTAPLQVKVNVSNEAIDAAARVFNVEDFDV